MVGNQSRADEETPLIQHVATRPPHQRYPHQFLRKFCTAVLSSAVVVVVLLFCVYLALPQLNGRHHAHRDTGLDYGALQKILQQTPDPKKAREWSKYYTAGPHLAGKNESQAKWTRDLWKEFGISSTSIVSYEVLLNYPNDHRLALIDTSDDGKATIVHEAKLEEDILEEDWTTGLSTRIPTFHGYSASGNVTAGYVFANYGSFFDFDDLVRAGIDLKDKIALVKYGGPFRGLKIKRAQELGMIGVLIYSDPGDDGDVQARNGFEAYPEGPAREPSSVQRGSAQFLSIYPGDPTTPGYPSKPGVPRQSTNETIPQIPSLPISYEDALPLLRALNGHGPRASSINRYWEGGGLEHKGVKYYIGPSPANLEINLVNKVDYEITPIWNVIGIINGTIPDQVVILGNHRDAWIAGGAADPNSGSAALNEVVRSFATALKAGWKPTRTIVFASWDAEEYGLVGSTEWVEEYIPWLSKSALAYLNVDVATAGPDFSAAAAPLLNKALIETAHEVQSPNQTIKGQTVGDVWRHPIRTIGSGSDFTAFQDYIGVPCVDMGFRPAANTPVYHYHSNYDSFYWMDNYGDPTWEYHVTAAKMWSLLAARLSEKPVIQFNVTDYAKALRTYLEKIKEKAKSSGLAFIDEDHEEPFAKLDKVIAEFRVAAELFDAQAQKLEEDFENVKDDSWFSVWPVSKLSKRWKRINHAYQHLERQFLHPEGLDNRHWFKHSVFAPGIWTGYAGAVFPGLVENVESGDAKAAQRWEKIIIAQLRDAIDLLQ